MAALGMRAAALPVRATARVAARPLVARAVPLVQKAALVSQPLVRARHRLPISFWPAFPQPPAAPMV